MKYSHSAEVNQLNERVEETFTQIRLVKCWTKVNSFSKEIYLTFFCVDKNSNYTSDCETAVIELRLTGLATFPFLLVKQVLCGHLIVLPPFEVGVFVSCIEVEAPHILLFVDIFVYHKVFSTQPNTDAGIHQLMRV
jgi:hypothetical protein